ncbi:MAG: DNA adenine methylase [candidate division WS2 bacterium]|nr:DNA adenine methylase [Candidatus Psychracetigena formicireducens]
MESKLRSPIIWIGGKHFMVDNLLPLIPKHEVYCEVFGGGASLLVRKKPSKIEFYNDINSGLVNFFRVLRDEVKSERLYELLRLVPYSREEYCFCRENWDRETDDIKRAIMWFVTIRQSFTGRFGGSWGYGVGRAGNSFTSQASKWTSSIEMLPSISKRLRKVLIENLDYKDIIERVDSKHVFFYLDPPYLPETRKWHEVYEYEMSYEDHEVLLDIITKVGGKVMISGYNSDLYNTALSSWAKREFDVTCHSQGITRESKITRRHRRVEVVWMNYKLNSGLFDEVKNGNK